MVGKFVTLLMYFKIYFKQMHLCCMLDVSLKGLKYEVVVYVGVLGVEPSCKLIKLRNLFY